MVPANSVATMSTSRLGQVLVATDAQEGGADSAPGQQQAPTYVSAAGGLENQRPRSSISEGVASAGGVPQVKGRQGWSPRHRPVVSSGAAATAPSYSALTALLHHLPAACCGGVCAVRHRRSGGTQPGGGVPGRDVRWGPAATWLPTRPPCWPGHTACLCTLSAAIFTLALAWFALPCLPTGLHEGGGVDYGFGETGAAGSPMDFLQPGTASAQVGLRQLGN